MVCIIITDGMVTDEKLDLKALKESTNYPISYIGIGVGNGPFGALEHLDDKIKGKFDNFHFLNFNEIESITKDDEKPALQMTIHMFSELPD